MPFAHIALLVYGDSSNGQRFDRRRPARIPPVTNSARSKYITADVTSSISPKRRSGQRLESRIRVCVDTTLCVFNRERLVAALRPPFARTPKRGRKPVDRLFSGGCGDKGRPARPRGIRDQTVEAEQREEQEVPAARHALAVQELHQPLAFTALPGKRRQPPWADPAAP